MNKKPIQDSINQSLKKALFDWLDTGLDGQASDEDKNLSYKNFINRWVYNDFKNFDALKKMLIKHWNVTEKDFINTTESECLQFLYQEFKKLINKYVKDSIQLKPYVITNHDSGKTYKVKAVNYQDALDKYNKFIVQDSKLNEKVVKAMIGEEVFNKLPAGYKNTLLESGMDELADIIKKKGVEGTLTYLFGNKVNKYTTKDALSKFVQSYLSTKKVSSKAEQDEIIKFLLERNKIVAEDIPKVRSLLKIVKDSITEDADIAQTDIKSTYLPEDANADNIRYIGFNEDRKISFYQYGDDYFAYHELDNRSEKLDKDTVQRILKKNILDSNVFEDANEDISLYEKCKKLLESVSYDNVTIEELKKLTTRNINDIMRYCKLINKIMKDPKGNLSGSGPQLYSYNSYYNSIKQILGR